MPLLTLAHLEHPSYAGSPREQSEMIYAALLRLQTLVGRKERLFGIVCGGSPNELALVVFRLKLNQH